MIFQDRQYLEVRMGVSPKRVMQVLAAWENESYLGHVIPVDKNCCARDSFRERGLNDRTTQMSLNGCSEKGML